MDDETLSRREFTRESVLALLSGVVITITGCGSDSSSVTGPSSGGGGGGGGAAGGVNGVVSANHGHIATVSDAEINAANDVSLDIRGNADHTHSVNLTGAQLTQIGNGQQVATTSTNNDGHNHRVTFN
jgi:hypothetical protein